MVPYNKDSVITIYPDGNLHISGRKNEDQILKIAEEMFSKDEGIYTENFQAMYKMA